MSVSATAMKEVLLVTCCLLMVLEEVAQGSSYDENSTVQGLISPCMTSENCTSFLLHSVCSNEECVCERPYEVLDTVLRECLKPASLNSTCRSDLQCEYADHKSFCNPIKKQCLCVEGFIMKVYPEVGINCIKHKSGWGDQVSPMVIIIFGVMLAALLSSLVLRLVS